MKVHAKCNNYAGCLQAYRGEEIELPAGAPLVCPECGKPLTTVRAPGSVAGKLIPIAVIVALVAGGIFYFARPLIFSNLSKKEPTPSTSTAPADPGTTASTTTPSTTNPPVEKTESPKVAEPPPVVTAPQQIDLSLTKKENQQVKDDVLKRIDLMPNVTAANKDKLYNSVERARSMGKVLTIPFGSGKMTLGAAEAQALKEQLEQPSIMKLRDDPTAVFVILGYADPKGDEKKNVAISQARADAVLEAMRDKASVNNVMHSVAMGGSTIVDAKDLEKNRIVEVWAVLP